METIWEIQYEHSGDCKKVWDYLASIKEDDPLDFAGDKEFWMEFLARK